MLDYKLIDALATVVREGGFDRAADRLCLTQSAVSQRIKLLERQSGQILLSRTKPPRPTGAGQRMIKHYLQVKRLEDDLSRDLAGPTGEGFASLAVGVNADSLATWFPEAVDPFVRQSKVLLDIHIDDQDQTRRLLKDGRVVGCVSAQEQPVQGCRAVRLGRMNYRLVAAPEFIARWFPDGPTAEAVRRAPAMVFNRSDEMHDRIFRLVFDQAPGPLPIHYAPSSETFAQFIISGLAYGALPDQQCGSALRAGRLIDLAPGRRIPVDLYWHCWNLKSDLLEKLTAALVGRAPRLLPN